MDRSLRQSPVMEVVMDVHQIIDNVIDNYRKDNYGNIYYLLALDIQNKKWTNDCVSVIFDRILSSNYIMPESVIFGRIRSSNYIMPDEPDNDEGFMHIETIETTRGLDPLEALAYLVSVVDEQDRRAKQKRTLHRELLHRCQSKFDELFTSSSTDEDKDQVLKCMRFIGYYWVYMRSMAFTGVAEHIFDELLRGVSPKSLHEEWKVELACELFSVCSPKLNRGESGKALAQHVLIRIEGFKVERSHHYSERTSARIQKLLDDQALARRTHDLMIGGPLSNAFDFIDALSLARSCCVSEWLKRFICDCDKFNEMMEQEKERVYNDEADSEPDESSIDWEQERRRNAWIGLDMYGQG
ncbi:unnamed protein product [Prorocentrum cordatum]|uniref:Uncharacterized protein n=1 Tax=Prorocentrum cordatum TaxID=2364126 RepID=A0ABN9QKK7_9DINO|nr:unnamed protein product [Polarella glacialis]|mmetsp:Transcript_65012/g.175653  ORF Transcript_65012/g.175653 Transcript_65012/m.175653 type:complete len:355 (-) Transcript_65012:584-1648(-)